MRYCYAKLLKQLILLNCCAFLTLITNAAVHPQQVKADKIFHALYHRLNKLPSNNMPLRLDIISGQFLDKPYALGALGEGINARYDQEPRYRADAFDCDTYVTTTLALALAENEHNFKQCMSKVRYKQGLVRFINRNHFMSIDWNINNQQQGFIKDITESFHDQNNKPIAKIASAFIDKPSWYQHFTANTIRLNLADDNEKIKRLAELKTKGSSLEKRNAQIAYLPLTTLFNLKKEPNQYLFEQIPNASIIEIVRPNWNLREKIGTNLNVSHLGFAFWHNGTLYFRQASSEYGKIVQIPLIDYLRKTLASPTIKGINIQMIVPQNPMPDGCG